MKMKYWEVKMKLIKKSDMKLIITKYVGKGTTDEGEEVELRTTVQYAPVIVFPDGDMVVMNWNDIYDIAKAKKYENSEVQNESNKDANN